MTQHAALIQGLAQDGLVQFGRFVHEDGAVWPVALRLQWLPSYPACLREIAGALVPDLAACDADRILAAAEAVPLSVALGLLADVPVAYPYGAVRDYTAAFAIEGAYDVGHPTVLVSDVLLDAAHAETITALARRVGLNVSAVLAVVDVGLGARERLEASGYGVRTLFSLRDMLRVLADQGMLPPLMRHTVEAWLDAERAGGA